VFIIVFSSRGRKMPVGTSAWLAIALFGLIDASCFQGFLTEGLRKTSAGLGSVSSLCCVTINVKCIGREREKEREIE
jgi:hypothetical protein